MCFGLAAHAIDGNETDRLALLDFKAGITEDPLEIMSSWNESVNFCQWNGVKCGRQHQRVTVLDLHSLQLVGFISPHIGNLSFLRELLLQNNSFNGEIPPEVGRLGRLETLRLDRNSLGGEIPSNISSWSNLISLNIGFNSLVGKLPGELGSLSMLQFLAVQANNLSGSIPLSFGNLSSLWRFSATQNNLVGSIPDGLGLLKNLTYIALGQNMLSGTIPPSFFNLSSLEVFDVSSNQIHGSLPSDIGNSLPNLEFLGIGLNQFTGTFPVSITNASKLVNLIITGNQLTGKVPSLEKLNQLSWLSMSTNNLGTEEPDDLNFLSSLANASSLELLTINANNFGGMLPESIGNLSTMLAIFLVDNNHIYGGIPSGIVNLVNLERLEVWNNQLSGNIPSDIGKLQELEVLIFNGNNFSGIVPSSIGNLTKLSALRLSSNNLHGSIPSSIGNCQNLLALDLSYNNLSGSIPPAVVSLSSLSIYLSLSQNYLTGSLPLEVGNLKNLGELDVYDNMLSGKIPSSLGSCTRLELLSMQGNSFQGSIPSSFRSLQGLTGLDLSRNNLSGQIPEFFDDFGLMQSLNLSYNNFEGEVPNEGVFKNSSATSIVGNSQLCGGIPEFQLPRCVFHEPKKSSLSLAMKIVISTVGGILGIGLVLPCLILYRLNKKKKEPTSSSSEKSLLRVSYQSLLKATDGFSSSNFIGVGSFGSVYKGILDQEGTVIAVKVLNLQRKGASKSFIAECEALKNVRHRNLVKVLTACAGADYQGNDFKALVYEFMVNGSLEQWLHPTTITEEPNAPSRKLSLLQRLNIAIDVAYALDYLHHQCQTPIIHCDLKPSNVLLDAEMSGHVGDFGIAKFLPEAANNIPSNQSSSIGVRGSVGYAAPGSTYLTFHYIIAH